MENNENRSGFEIDIFRILKVIMSRFWVILLVSIIVGVRILGFVYRDPDDNSRGYGYKYRKKYYSECIKK